MRTRSSYAPASRAPSRRDHAAVLPIPFGWYALVYGADLAPGDVRPLYYFDEHLVLFRTEDGRAHATAAFCPHLGAHLGYGGRVEGNAVTCPFHGWQFDGDGVCISVPYANAIPRRAAHGPCLYSYPVVERNRMIWVWHHPRRVPPLFELDNVPEMADPDWSEPVRYEWEVNAPIQESGENAVDVAHFVTVHGARDMPHASITLSGHRRETDLALLTPAIDEAGNLDFVRTETLHLVTRSCGPGMSIQTFEMGAKTIMLGTTTPITPTRMQLRFAFTRRLDTPARFQPLVDGLITEIVRQVEQDIPIWENKVFRQAPILCDGDGPIAKYRRWFSQFYDNADAPEPNVSRTRVLIERMPPVFDQIRGFFRHPGARALARMRGHCRALVAALGEIPGLIPRYAWLLRPHPAERKRASTGDPNVSDR